LADQGQADCSIRFGAAFLVFGDASIFTLRHRSGNANATTLAA
jgi:hypothetical protein